MDYWDWVDKYTPIPNHLDDNAAVDGYLFTNFGNQWEFVKQFAIEKTWSLVITDLDDGSASWEITAGVHVIKRNGFLLTQVNWNTDTSVIY